MNGRKEDQASHILRPNLDQKKCDVSRYLSRIYCAVRNNGALVMLIFLPGKHCNARTHAALSNDVIGKCCTSPYHPFQHGDFQTVVVILRAIATEVVVMMLGGTIRLAVAFSCFIHIRQHRETLCAVLMMPERATQNIAGSPRNGIITDAGSDCQRHR